MTDWNGGESELSLARPRERGGGQRGPPRENVERQPAREHAGQKPQGGSRQKCHRRGTHATADRRCGST